MAARTTLFIVYHPRARVARYAELAYDLVAGTRCLPSINLHDYHPRQNAATLESGSSSHTMDLKIRQIGCRSDGNRVLFLERAKPLSVLDMILLRAAMLLKFKQRPVNLMHDIVFHPPSNTRRGVDLAQPKRIQMVFVTGFFTGVKVVVDIVNRWLRYEVFLAATLRYAFYISWLQFIVVRFIFVLGFEV
jgi:hypothetical protein